MKRILLALVLAAVPALASAQSPYQNPPAASALAPPIVVFPGSASQVLAVDGSASAPSVAFASQQTMGFYRAATNRIGYGVGGTLFQYFDGNQFVVARDNGLFALGASADTAISRVAAGEFGWTAVLFANLGTPANGTFTYCSDCTIANPCASGGTGALAKRLNGVWVCS